MAVIDIEYGLEILETSHPKPIHQEIKEMEMVLQNSSYGHEYAMLELQKSEDFLMREELHDRLEQYKNAYFQARQYLSDNHPERLRILERDLLEQKMKIFKTYTA